MRSTATVVPTNRAGLSHLFLSTSLSLFRLLSQEWCWWFPRMRTPTSVYFVYFVKSISPECLVDLLNSNVVMSSAAPRDERSLPEQKTGGVEGEERTTLEILKSIPCVVMMMVSLWNWQTHAFYTFNWLVEYCVVWRCDAIRSVAGRANDSLNRRLWLKGESPRWSHRIESLRFSASRVECLCDSDKNICSIQMDTWDVSAC